MKFCVNIPIDIHIMQNKSFFLFGPSKGPYLGKKAQIGPFSHKMVIFSKTVQTIFSKLLFSFPCISATKCHIAAYRSFARKVIYWGQIKNIIFFLQIYRYLPKMCFKTPGTFHEKKNFGPLVNLDSAIFSPQKCQNSCH